MIFKRINYMLPFFFFKTIQNNTQFHSILTESTLEQRQTYIDRYREQPLCSLSIWMQTCTRLTFYTSKVKWHREMELLVKSRFFLWRDSCWSVGGRKQTTRALCALMRNKDKSEEVCNIWWLDFPVDVGLVIKSKKRFPSVQVNGITR